MKQNGAPNYKGQGTTVAVAIRAAFGRSPVQRLVEYRVEEQVAVTEVLTKVRQLRVCRTELRGALERRDRLMVARLGDAQERIINDLERSANRTLTLIRTQTPFFVGEFRDGAYVPDDEGGAA